MTKHWSPQQVEALAAIDRWFEDSSRPFFYLAGYAGTGKTTLVAEIARTKGTVVFGSFTGKAAAVMREKGCKDATTIDSLIYRPQIEDWCADDPPCDDPPCRRRCQFARERFVGRTLNLESAVAKANLVIIDEVSMVGEEMGRDLLSFGRPVLVLGDVAQLPPIAGAGFFTKNDPDFQLTQVHRQARGSPVIDLATRARKRRRLKRGTYGDSAVIEGIFTDDLLNHDQVIVGTHLMRQRLNRKIRRGLGFKGTTPEIGEKVMCLKNNAAKGLRNGTIWTVLNVVRLRDGFTEMTITDGQSRRVRVHAPDAGFVVHDGSGSDLPGQPFCFGYAITCHKAQGSQWDSVLVVDESLVFGEHRYRWLYTAITRAAQRVTVVKL